MSCKNEKFYSLIGEIDSDCIVALYFMKSFAFSSFMLSRDQNGSQVRVHFLVDPLYA